MTRPFEATPETLADAVNRAAAVTLHAVAESLELVAVNARDLAAQANERRASAVTLEDSVAEAIAEAHALGSAITAEAIAETLREVATGERQA